jgi:hypothetical protein
MYFTYTSLNWFQNLVLSSVNIFTVSERSAAMFVLLAIPCNMEIRISLGSMLVHGLIRMRERGTTNLNLIIRALQNVTSITNYIRTADLNTLVHIRQDNHQLQRVGPFLVRSDSIEFAATITSQISELQSFLSACYSTQHHVSDCQAFSTSLQSLLRRSVVSRTLRT